MKKIPTLFKKDPTNLGRVINEINPECQWAVDSPLWFYRKFDGTACAIIDGELYKRYDAKKGKTAPVGAIPCQDADPITGHHPHWVKCSREDKQDQYHFEAFDKESTVVDGTYELVGPKIQGNPEKFSEHTLINHEDEWGNLQDEADYLEFSMRFEDIKEFLSNKRYSGMEGIIIRSKINEDLVCKITKEHFGLSRDCYQ